MSCVLASVPNHRFLQWILVIIIWSICASLQMAWFLCQSHHLGTNQWSLSCPSIVGGGGCCLCEAHCAKLVWGVYSYGGGCLGWRKTILAREIYCAKPNTKLDSQSGSWVRKVLVTRDMQSILKYGPTAIIVIRSLTQLLTFQNWFFHFWGHKLTQSSEYGFGLLTQHLLNWEYKRRIFIHC